MAAPIAGIGYGNLKRNHTTQHAVNSIHFGRKLGKVVNNIVVRKIVKLQTTILPVILMLLLSSCIPSKSGTKSLALDTTRNTYTHEQSGFFFPPTVGRFLRDNDIKFYNDRGNNFSVPYNLVATEEKCVGTIYIYPSLKDYSITPIPKFGQTPAWFLKERYDEAKNVNNGYVSRQR